MSRISVQQARVNIANLLIESVHRCFPDVDLTSQTSIPSLYYCALVIYRDELMRVRDRQDADLATLAQLKTGIRKASKCLTYLDQNKQAMAGWHLGLEPANATQHFANVCHHVIRDLTFSVAAIEEEAEEYRPGSQAGFDRERAEYYKSQKPTVH